MSVMPTSPVVGRSGNVGQRLAEVSASGTTVPAVAEKIGRIYYRPVDNTPEEYASALVIERNQWEPLIHKLGLARKE